MQTKINQQTESICKKFENNLFKPEFLSTFGIDFECQLWQIGAFEQNKDNQGVVNEDIIQAEFEADSILALQYKWKCCYFILSTDSNFHAYGGPNTIMLKSVKCYAEK